MAKILAKKRRIASEKEGRGKKEIKISSSAANASS
jgi:hypothetical protein